MKSPFQQAKNIMKNLILNLTLIFTCLFTGNLFAQQDSIFIEGPTSVCVGECATYYFTAYGELAPFPIWSVSGSVLQNGENPAVICFDIPGVAFISAFDDEFGVEAGISVSVNESIFTEIESSAAECPDNADEECETVCAGTTVTYTLPNVSADVSWTISGSDDYEISGNSVLVNWNTPGTGTVEAVSMGQTTGGLNINCGVFENSGPNTIGSGYVYIEGNAGGYELSIEGANGINLVMSGTNGLNIIDQLEPGTYSVTVISADGQTAICEFLIPFDFECFLTVFPEEIQSNTACNGQCNGQVILGVNGFSAPYTFQWSNGSTTQNLDFACAGTYSVTVVDGNGCLAVQNFTLADFGCQPTCGSEASICVEILEEPNAEFTSVPAPNGNNIEICEGQTVFFENQSTGAETFIWDFGDFNTSVQANPEHTYENPGTYTVSLIARNECFCSDTTSMTINVIDADIPDIGCVGTICEGESVTYTSGADCGTFNWAISGNGMILDGGGSNDDFITVEWGNGPSGSVELSVEGCSGNVCTLPNVEFIPIISDAATIDGPNQVCNNSEAIYALPKYDGTDYVWTVSNFGTIVDGQGTHRITVDWNGTVPNNAQSVSVDYENCYLGCGGSDVLSVSILPEFYVLGQPSACEDGEAIFYGKNAETDGQASLNWQLFAPDGSVSYTSVGASISEMIPFNDGAGTYRLVATPGIATDWCSTDYELLIVVESKPDAPTAISGEVTVCAGEPYAYTAISTLANAGFVWQINDGGTITTAEGNPINVVWSGSGSYEISAAQIDTDGLNCQSDFISQTVNPIGGITVTGDDDVCLEETVIYTATDYVGVDYDWTISPASAGTIASGAGKSEVEVFWTSATNATLTLTVCGNIEATSVLVRPKPIPVISAPEWLCFNETATISTSVTYDTYDWKDEDGITVSNLATPDLGPGFYDVLVTNEFGCTENISFKISQYPPPTVSISTPDASNICPPEGDPYPTFYAENTEAGYNFQWYHNNVAVGTDSPIFATSAGGSYQVEVTDINGCSVLSNIANVDDTCSDGDPGGGQCNGGGTIVCDPDIDYVFFDAIQTAECNTFEFVSTTPNQVSVNGWNFDDNTGSLEESPTHTFENAGFYRVILNATIDLGGVDVVCEGTGIVTVPVAAKFDAQSACAGEELIFTDLSTFIPGEGIASRIWDFGDPLSGVDNTSTDAEPTHIYSAEGTYTVTLIVTSDNGCISIKTLDVLVYPNPDVSFLQPEVNCAATSLEFNSLVSSNVTEVVWDFGDAASGDANTSTAFTAYHEFATPGVYTVTLTATSIYGCSEIYSLDITVEPNGLNGDIAAAPSATLCDGDVATLTAPPGGIAWEWSTGETTESITVNTADVYEVTITDDFGCTYSPDGLAVDVLPLPQGDIYAVEYDDFGNPINYNFNTQEVCEGEDVFLEIEESPNYSYVWSTGSTTFEEEFSEDRGNQLTEGTYDISVNITNDDTGCTNISTYQVIVHGVPQNVTIVSDSGFPICAGSGATLSVQSPNAAYDYVWNTGEIGTSIVIIAGGEYWVTAVNEFGCEGESNHIDVENAPDIDKIPDGCHTRCAPDTICLPTMQNISSYQWYFNNVAIPAPEGTIPNLIAEESGEYYLVMEDIFGCTATSDPLTLDLYDGFGTIAGEVWLDVNENGMIDAGDQLVPDVNIDIFDNAGTNQGTATTNNTGEYAFPNILSTEYDMVLDTMSLPEETTYTIYEIATELVGCDAEETVDWLIIPFCEDTDEGLTFISCDGAPVVYEGVSVDAGTEEIVTLVNSNGCDSVVTVTVVDAFTPPSSETYEVCGTETIVVEGITLSAGDTQDISYMNEYNCEYFVTVSVVDAASPSSSENFTVCEDETMEFNGITVNAGETEDILYTNAAGCDSLVTVTLNTFSAASFIATAEESCWNVADGKIIIEMPTGGAAPYEFSLDGVGYGVETEFTDLIGGDYTVYVRDANGCDISYELEVPTSPRLEVQALDQIIDCDETDVELEAFVNGGRGDISIAWITGEIGDTTEVLTVEEPGIYTFTATDACGTTEIEAEVAYEMDTRLSLIFVPNAFSPNNDGMNDKARGFAAANIEVLSYDLMIFDRWGNLMKEVKDVNDGWDGTYNGVEMTTNVFTYILKSRVVSCGIEKDISMAGDITLVR
jgi:gliding motility-associated-like protein